MHSKLAMLHVTLERMREVLYTDDLANCSQLMIRTQTEESWV